MKNIADKFKKAGKKVVDTAKKAKYVGAMALAMGAATNAYSQTIDRAQLSGMDPYSAPDIAKDSAYVVDNGWNSLNYAKNRADAKIAKAQERIPFYLDLMSKNVDCKIETKIFDFNFFGLDNFKNYTGFDDNGDGIPEGYDFYKTKMKLGIGAENIPMYEASLTTSGGVGHNIPCFFIGSNDSTVMDNPLDINQWYFFDYLTGKRVLPGDPLMSKDNPVSIRWLDWGPDAVGNYGFNYWNLVTFHLKDGAVEFKDGIETNLLKENPRQLYVEGQNDSIFVERGKDAPDLSPDKYGYPSAQTNSQHYTLQEALDSAKFVPFDPNYPEYGIETQFFSAGLKVGRWDRKNLPQLGKTLERKITIDDTIDPNVIAPKDTIVNNNVSTDPSNLGQATATDNSPYALNQWYEDNIVSNDGATEIIDRTFYAQDVRGNLGQATQRITRDLTTGVEDFSSNQKGIDVKVLGVPMNSNTKIEVSSDKYMEHGKVLIVNTLGQIVDEIEIDNLMPNEKREVGYRGFGSLAKGVYIVDFEGNGQKVKEKVQVR